MKNELKYKIQKQLLVVLFFSLLALSLSLIHQSRISSEGFSSLYQGPAYVDRGWPWRILRCYNTQINPHGNTGCFIEYNFLVLDFIFWSILGFVLLLIINGSAYLKSKLSNMQSKNKKS